MPLSNFIKIYSQMENEIPGIRDMSVREVEKNTKNFLTQNYLEPI